MWSADGGEIYYRSGAHMYAVAISRGERLEIGQPELLFDDRYATHPAGITNYDVTKDGNRFLMITETTPTELRVVTDWVAELEELLASE